MAKQLPLTQGKFAIVDDDVYEWASKYKWHAVRKKNSFYAVRNTERNPHQTKIHLHREIMSAPIGVMVDHINGDGLDNRRENMRFANYAENGRNRGMQTNNKSGYKGVGLFGGRWYSRIGVDGEQVHIGYFRDPEDAAMAYDAAAIAFHGDFAKTNF